jgi:glycosyltransferase involved in cell wall biosynthesis
VSVLFDIQGIQSKAHAERGIARYLIEVTVALERSHPDLIERYLLNPELPVPGAIEPLAVSGRLGYLDEMRPEPPFVFHVGSPIERLPIDAVWPPRVRRLPLVATVYDLIPQVFPHLYLFDPRVRRRYRTRLELLRRADRLLAISQATAADVIQHLDIPPERVFVVGAGVSGRFRPPSDYGRAVAEATQRVEGLEPGYLLYTGGIDPRKNIDRLLEAYAGLPKRLLADHQLVIVCRVTGDERVALGHRLDELGVAERVLFPGFLPDEDLVPLYQAAHLFVFPSLYEGFGLPVAEAIACGAAAIAARSSSLPELVRDEEVLFDPMRPAAIRSAIRRCLEDDRLLQRLRSRELSEDFSWERVADRTAEVYADLIATPRRARARRLRVAYISPLPPHQTGVADYSSRLLADLVELCDVDAFVEGDPDAIEAPAGVRVHGLAALDPVERAGGGFDRILCCLGNSEHHAGALALLRRRTDMVVLAHDVRLTGLYAWSAAYRPDLEPEDFQSALRKMYGNRIPSTLGETGWLEFEEYERYGVLMAREAIARSDLFAVHSRYAAQLARLDAAGGDQAKVRVVPFGYPEPAEGRREAGPPVVVSFGVARPVKQTDKIVNAFGRVLETHPDALLAFVGPLLEDERLRLTDLAKRGSFADRLRLTGYVEPRPLRQWAARSTVAVQLRAASNGESAASVADCFAAGIPTIATALGAARELPDDCLVKVERDVGTEMLAHEISALLADPDRRRSLAQAGQRYAREHSFAVAARAVFEELVVGRPAALAA